MSEFHIALMDYVQTGTTDDISEYLDNSQNQPRLAVYRNTFISSCIDALQRKYPSSEKLLGEDFFKTLAREFCILTPPTTPVLGEYGETFPEYLREILVQHHPELEYTWDICKLDRAWHQAYFADEKSPLSQTDIEALVDDIETKSLSLHPSVQLVQIDWTVTNLWSQLRESNVNEKIAIANQPENILLWRNNGSILHRVISKPESLFIANIYVGKPLGESAEIAMQSGEIDISDTFSQLLLNNLLT
ncbi:DNA-binding domain-containing protein [Aliiglaciecola sp. 3_MG-2023]|uniref:HvfC/BufC N-terminal domain-containing protein n=1 Tax=Aliiglaciecola sp. 3_MG-2023 TaxID=3062644 RepID=UPI0026E34611|nr:DNA-binding domain-containing protein [Aliiglaciecola sp. 3_MG-2023]MDO6691988.1 DNA-binding domain-containing protein [Aliiglaciecola sp. 3_MG-2023]